MSEGEVFRFPIGILGSVRRSVRIRPTEHELVAHGIFPMMPAQGWPELLLAVEWQKIELTVFNGMPTDAPRCELVCEANGTEQDLQNGIQWPAGYFERHG